MRKIVCIMLCLTGFWAQAGCGSVPGTESAAAPVPAMAASTGAPQENRDRKAPDPDAEGLARLLAAAAETQPCTAGSSLRLAALGGQLLQWLAGNPDWRGAPRRAAMILVADHGPSDRRRIGRTVCALHDAALRMGEEELRALLEDAGAALSGDCPAKADFLSFTEAVALELVPEIFKNPEGIMNIFTGSRCRGEKSVL